MTQGPAAGKPFYYGGKDCNFSELFFSDQAPAKKVIKYNTNRRELGRMAFHTFFKFTIFHFRSQCPLQELHSLPLDNSQLVCHQPEPDVRWLVSAEAHLAAVSSLQVAGDPSQRTWDSNSSACNRGPKFGTSIASTELPSTRLLPGI